MLDTKKIHLFLVLVFSCFQFSAFPLFSADLEEEDSIQECSLFFDLLFPEEETREEEVFVEGLDLIQKDRMPKRIAIIMDGNRRWAKKRGLPIAEGHWKGAGTVTKTAKFASRLGIEVLTLYAFSTENWSRPQEEVDELMRLMAHYIDEKTSDLIKSSIRLKTIGDLSALPVSLQAKLEKAKQDTAACDQLTLVLALNYGGRDEIRRAFREMAFDLEGGAIHKEDISEKLIESYLDTAEMGNPDLFIRTSGEYRLSNFLPWQLSYSELHFSPVLWPDFSEKDFVDAILEFQKRDRRFGGSSIKK